MMMKNEDEIYDDKGKRKKTKEGQIPFRQS
jgi:hypothetical protein